MSKCKQVLGQQNKLCDPITRKNRHNWARKFVPKVKKSHKSLPFKKKKSCCVCLLSSCNLQISFLLFFFSLPNLRYDIVFLPPSFPIVAMENPCLTFIISSILESDEFLIIDVIHEVAHSWFGNAVTNATWEEMWLSEGLATYAQRRITTETYGMDVEVFLLVLCLANNGELPA